MDNYSIDVKATGANLKRLCAQKGITAKELMNLLHLTTPTAVYKWWAGDNLPSIDNLIYISKYMDVKVEDVLVLVSDNNNSSSKGDI